MVSLSMKTFDDEIENVVSYYSAKSNVDIWQNTLVVVNSDYNEENAHSFALLSGPRIPSKKRGSSYSNPVYSVDWIPTLLGDADNSMDGFDMWDSIIYNKLSPRDNNDINEQRHKNVI